MIISRGGAKYAKKYTLLINPFAYFAPLRESLYFEFLELPLSYKVLRFGCPML